MFIEFDRWVSNALRQVIVLLVLGMTGLVGVIGNLTGVDANMGIFTLLIIGLAAWQ
jgi:hypothetical protein